MNKNKIKTYLNFCPLMDFIKTIVRILFSNKYLYMSKNVTFAELLNLINV